MEEPFLSDVPVVVDGEIFLVSTKTLAGRLAFEAEYAKFRLRQRELELQELHHQVDDAIAYLDPDRQQ